MKLEVLRNDYQRNQKSKSKKEIGVIMTSSGELNVTGESMREVPKSTLPDEALDKDKCREAIKSALTQTEPEQAFDRHAWLAKTKERLKSHASASQ